jgi:hypothetical protein
MNSIIWIVSDLLIDNYIYKSMNEVVNNNPNCIIYVVIEKITSNYRTFDSFIIKNIDSKLNGVKESALQKVDLKHSFSKNIVYIENINNLPKSQWVILPDYHVLSEEVYCNLSEFGILKFVNIYPEVIYNTIHKSLQDIKFKYRKPEEKAWNTISVMTITLEKGVINSFEKYLWATKIALNKFFTCKDYRIISECIYNNLGLKLYLGLYYSNLFLFILKRKINKASYNWKIVFKINNKLKYINQPKNTFWADPFIIFHNKQLFLFIEELNFNTNLGEISCLKLSDGYEVIEKKTIIKDNTHFSFPNVFNFNNDYYMIPENSQKNRLDIYKSTDFPYQWRFERTMIEDCKLIDAVWIFHNQKYWLFANKIQEYEIDNNDYLYLYYSDDLINGKWESHIKNPIVSLSSNARNGGKIIEKEGKIFRVSQNCSNSYGANVVVNEIIELSIENYIEVETHKMNPPKGYIGLHTYNQVDGVEVFDILINEKN